jgi:hypothetical protein
LKILVYTLKTQRKKVHVVRLSYGIFFTSTERYLYSHCIHESASFSVACHPGCSGLDEVAVVSIVGAHQIKKHRPIFLAGSGVQGRASVFC